MILDDVYTAIIDRINTADPPLGIVTIDWFNEQPARMEMSDDIDALRLPAALIRYDQPEWKVRGRRRYEATATIHIDILRDNVNNQMVTDAATGDVTATRATYDQVQAVAKRIVGLMGDTFGTFGYIGSTPDHSYSKFRLDTISFRCLLRSEMDPTVYEHHELPALGIIEQQIDPPSGNDVTVTNSDSSYVRVVPAPGSLLLANVTHVNSDGTPVILPAMTPFTASLCLAPTPSHVQNSDLTYDVVVAPGDTLPLPDVTHTDSDGAPVTIPAMTPFVATPAGSGDPVSILDQDENLVQSVAPGGVYHVLVISGIRDPLTPTSDTVLDPLI
ncbi:MAG: hypothetical protein ABI432_08655 [Flavobacteriales bacterium]